jgi:hypothetical protein
MTKRHASMQITEDVLNLRWRSLLL